VKELALHILDLLQNSVEAGASRVGVDIIEDATTDQMVVEVRDDGKGMAPELVERVLDPFVTTRRTRRVGLGLPLLAASARQAGGEVRVESSPGAGTRIVASFGLSHVDRAPLGDMAATIVAILAANPQLKLHYRHRRDGGEALFDTEAIEERMGSVPWDKPQVALWARDAIRSGLATLSASAPGPARDKGR
jgi:anti-sigma regulatory factor (Ser/Thr protein kinase)